jgi:plastocyanin
MAEETPHTLSPVALLGVVLLTSIAGAMLFFSWAQTTHAPTIAAPLEREVPQNVGVSAPIFSPETKEKLETEPVFQALATYTEKGFEPKIVKVSKGQVVRFTNSSSRDMWVVSSGQRLYPRTKDMCGSSDLDSCEPVVSGDFWQFEFAQPGTWEVTNNFDKRHAVTVVVQ